MPPRVSPPVLSRNAAYFVALPGLLDRWQHDRAHLIERQTTGSNRAAVNQSIVKFLRMAMQSLVIGLGADW